MYDHAPHITSIHDLITINCCMYVAGVPICKTPVGYTCSGSQDTATSSMLGTCSKPSCATNYSLNGTSTLSSAACNSSGGIYTFASGWCSGGFEATADDKFNNVVQGTPWECRNLN